MLTAVVHPIVPILNQNGAHASSPVDDAQFTTETIANVETHIISVMIAHTIPDRSCRSLPDLGSPTARRDAGEPARRGSRRDLGSRIGSVAALASRTRGPFVERRR